MHRLHVPACARRAAEAQVRQWFPRVPLPHAVRVMRDRRRRKASRSSQKIRQRQEAQHE